MNDQYHDREQEIFLACLREPDPNARAELLARQCGDDTALREAVELLLRSQEDASAFLEAPFELTEAPTTATMSTAELDAMVGATIGPYKLREKLGEGGMGVVFVAEQKHPVRRKVAIKVVKPGLDSKEVIARFEAERQALALMDHPNIAKVLDAGVTETGRPYFAMDLVQGLAITKYCEKRRLGIRARLKLFGQVCRAVQHAHQKGIIHRDLKPSNVLVAEIDGVAVPKVIDFGVAKAVGQKLTDQSVYTQFWQLIGTPLYMSPEQAGFGVIDVDTRSDVYSLGVLLYELLSGTTPLEKQVLKELGYDELRRRIREEDPPRPSVRLSLLDAEHSSTIADSLGVDQREHSRLLRGELDWIVMRALEKDRSRRYESPSAFAADIDRYLNDEPVEACPPSRWYQLRKLASRHKSALSTVAVVLIALLTATGVSLWQAKEANEARKLADQRLAQADTNYQHALNAVEQMLQRVGSHELATTPKMLAVQKELLENAVTFYEQLIEENPTDPHVYFLTSQAYGSLHQVASRMSNRDLDSEHCLKSVTLAKRALSMKPGSHEYAGQLAYSYHLLAYSTRPRDPVYAEAMYREGLKAISEIPKSHLSHRQTEAKLAHNLARLLTNSRRQEAEQLYLRAISALETDNPEVKAIDKAHAYAAHARALWEWGKYPEAEAAFQKAIQYCVQCVEESPNTIASKDARYQLLIAHNNFADLYETTKRTREAEEHLRTSYQLATKLREDFPDVLPYQNWHRRAFSRLHQFQVDSNRQEDAIALLEGFNPQTPQDYFERAIAYEGLGEPSRAIEDFQKSIATDSSNGIAHYHLAKLHTELGQTEMATASLLQAANHIESLSRPEIPKLAQRLVDAKRYEDAVRVGMKALELAPKHAAGYHALYVAHLAAGNLEQAIEYISQALELNPSAWNYSHRGDAYTKLSEHKKALQDYDAAIQRASGSSSDLKYFFERRGNSYLSLSEYDKAFQAYDAAIQRAIEEGSDVSWYLYKRRAVANFYLNRFEYALKDLTTAVELNPQDGSTLRWIPLAEVVTCENLPFQNDMKSLADKLVELDNHSAIARFERLNLRAAFGEFDQVADNLKVMVPASRDWYNYHQYLVSLLALKVGDRVSYRTVCQQMLERFQGSEVNIDLHFSAWTCSLGSDAIDDYDAAINCAQQCVDSEPDSQQYVNGLGAVLFRAGRFAEAKRHLERAIEVSADENTSSSYSHYFLALTEHHLGNSEAAEEQLRIATEATEKELAETALWNRKLTLELLREEAVTLIRGNAAVEATEQAAL